MPDIKYTPVPYDSEAFLKKAMKRKGFKKAYGDLDEEYKLISGMLNARLQAGLTQEAVAERMGTTKSAVSRLEAVGKHSPSIATLEKYAQALGCRLEIKFVPDSTPRARKRRQVKQESDSAVQSSRFDTK